MHLLTNVPSVSYQLILFKAISLVIQPKKNHIKTTRQSHFSRICCASQIEANITIAFHFKI